MAAKFNPTQYDPAADSSDGQKRAAKKDGAVILKVEEGQCPCGCGNKPAGKGTFLPGHDAKLRGILIRAHLTGTEVVTISGGLRQSSSAEKVATFYGDHFAQSVAKAAEREAGKAAAREARAKERAAAKAKEPTGRLAGDLDNPAIPSQGEEDERS